MSSASRKRSTSRKSTENTTSKLVDKTNVVVNAAVDKQRNTPLSTNIHTLATWAYLWIFLSSIVVIWDASYILLRPLSMYKGSLYMLFMPYSKYITVDKLYGDINNPFVKAQSIMNIMECVVNYIGLYVYHIQYKRGNRRNVTERTGLVILLCSVSATLAKTLLYGIHDMYHTPSNTAHNNYIDWIFVYIIPNGLWIVVPAAVCVHIGSKLAHTNTSSRSKAQ